MHTDVSRGVLLVLLLTFSISTVYALKRAFAQPEPVATVETAHGVIRFVIDGREIARIDADGLHVDGDIRYAGVAVDNGSKGSAGSAAKPGAPHAR